MKHNLLSPPSTLSKLVSMMGIISFLGALYGGGYGFSIQKDEISSDLFTVSQSLAFGNKTFMVIFFVVAFSSIIYLNYVRGPSKLLYARIFLLLLIFSFILTIIWITTYENENLHYIFAGVIFVSILLFITIVTILYQKYFRKYREKYVENYVMDLNLMFGYSALVMLLSFGIFFVDNTTSIDDEIFAANENMMVLFTVIPVIYLGFV